MADDLFSIDDLQALQELHQHLVSTGDARADKVGAFLNSQKSNIAPPPPARAPLPFELQNNPEFSGFNTGATRLSTLGRVLASPFTGIAGIPSQLMEFAQRGFHNPPSGGVLSEEPITQAYGNALAAMAPLPQRETVPAHFSRAGEAGGSVLGGLAEKLLPAKIRLAINLMKSSPEEGQVIPQRSVLRSPFGLTVTPSTLPRTPLWEGAEPVGSNIPEFSSAPQTELPSGRIPGHPVQLPPQPPRVPLWQGIGSGGTSAPEFSPIPQTELPSGRVPGSPVRVPAQPPRVPLWSGVEPTGSNVPGFESIPQTVLPSGRIPGVPKIGPVEWPGSTTPIPPVGPVEGEATVLASNPLQPIDKFEMNRLAHARAQEAELPGSPAGKNGHPQLSVAAKENFGVDSWSKLNVKQMKQIYEYLDTNGVLPKKGQLPKL